MGKIKLAKLDNYARTKTACSCSCSWLNLKSQSLICLSSNESVVKHKIVQGLEKVIPSRIPAPFSRESRTPRFCRRYPKSIVFFSNTASVPNLWWIPLPGSSQISYSVNFSRIPRCILAKFRITRIAFQTLIIVWDNSFFAALFFTLFLE